MNGTAQYDLLLGAEGLEKVRASGDTRLLGGEERVKKAKFEGWIPRGSKVFLVKVGILNCHSGICELVLEP